MASTPENVTDQRIDIDIDARVDAKPKAPRPTATVRLGGQSWTVEKPDAGVMMEIEESQLSSRVFALLFDEQWSKVRPFVERLELDDMSYLLNQLGDQLEFSAQALQDMAAPNRRARRQRGR